MNSNNGAESRVGAAVQTACPEGQAGVGLPGGEDFFLGLVPFHTDQFCDDKLIFRRRSLLDGGFPARRGKLIVDYRYIDY